VVDEEARKGHVHWVVRSGAFDPASEVERRFEEMVHARWQPRSGVEPPADVFLVGRELWVEVDLPGVPENQVQVRIESGELVIEARRDLDPPAPDAPALRRERSRGTLRRRLRLPHPVEKPALAIHTEAGVLRVRIWSSEEREA
jgi:HSP20 family protein